MKKHLKLATLFVAAALFMGANAFSQEWENVFEYNNDDYECTNFFEVKELSDGNIGVPSCYYYRSGYGDFYSGHPGVVKISSDGTELSKNYIYKEGYLGTSRAPFLFENSEGDLFALTTFGPDHDYTYFNYFKNFDNPPTDAIIGLYKLDENLQVEKSYEHSYPIDTFEFRGDLMWEMWPNETSGNIFIISAFEDEGDIVGAYVKSVSKSPDYRGNDSLFFFRMNFDGEFLNKKGYDLGAGGGSWQTSHRRNQIIKTGSHYMYYSFDRAGGESAFVQGSVKYYDLDFNYIMTKYIDCKNCGGYPGEYLYNIAVKRSDHNTTYLVSDKDGTDGSRYNDCRLYEINDDINTVSDNLTIERYCHRGTQDWDASATYCGVDIADDNTIFFTYQLCKGYVTPSNSYVMIERLDSEFGNISTLYYDISEDEEIATGVFSIHITEDQGVIICGYADDLNSDTDYYYITKFPASAFDPDNIEEAHAHNLKVAVAYPNPGGDVMNIRTSLRNCTLHVYDMQGRMVHQQEITDDVTSVDASNWQRGTYVWELGTENGNGNGSRILESGKWVK